MLPLLSSERWPNWYQWAKFLDSEPVLMTILFIREEMFSSYTILKSPLQGIYLFLDLKELSL